jgi:hypothetical protein
MRWRTIIAGLVLASACMGCRWFAGVIEEEGTSSAGGLGGGFENPAASAADYELQNRLCWEDERVVQATSKSGASQAHADCMKENGYSVREP